MSEQDTKPQPRLTGTAYVHAVVSAYIKNTPIRPIEIIGRVPRPKPPKPQRHNPKLVRRALKRLTRFTNREAFTKQIPLVKGLIIVNLIVQWLLLATHRNLEDQLVTQVGFCVIYLPLGFAWVVGQLDHRHLTAGNDIWYVSADGSVRSANDNVFNVFERRRLFRFTRETRVTLPTGESVLLFKDEPNILTVQAAIDFLVSYETEKNEQTRTGMIASRTLVRVGDVYRESNPEPEDFAIAPASEVRPDLKAPST